MRILCLLERGSRQIRLIRSNIFVLLRPFLNRGIFADSFILSNARHGARYPDPTGKLCPSASKPVPLVLGMPDEVGETGFAPLIPEDTEQIAQAIHDI